MSTLFEYDKTEVEEGYYILRVSCDGLTFLTVAQFMLGGWYITGADYDMWRWSDGEKPKIEIICGLDLDKITAAVSTPPAAPVRVPEGWQLVPKEPTKSQYEAAWGFREIERANGTIQPDWTWTCGQIYQAMLSASPSPVDSRDALIERLVKALEPFAKLGDDGWGSACPSERVLAVWWADDDKDPHKTKRPHITQGDIRNARRALLAAKEQQP